jgi:hypothetical protein
MHLCCAALQGWVVCLLWLAALQSPAAYKQSRAGLVTLVRLCMAVASAHSSKQLRDQIYANSPFESPQITLLTRFLLFPHIFSAVLEACSCPGLLLQAAAVAFKAACLLAGRGAQGEAGLAAAATDHGSSSGSYDL